MSTVNDGGGRVEARPKACDRDMLEQRSTSLGFSHLDIGKRRARLPAVTMPRQCARRCFPVSETVSHLPFYLAV